MTSALPAEENHSALEPKFRAHHILPAGYSCRQVTQSIYPCCCEHYQRQDTSFASRHEQTHINETNITLCPSWLGHTSPNFQNVSALLNGLKRNQSLCGDWEPENTAFLRNYCSHATQTEETNQSKYNPVDHTSPSRRDKMLTSCLFWNLCCFGSKWTYLHISTQWVSRSGQSYWLGLPLNRTS